jgi:phosphatidylinositol alpha-1,6-mannosyltransferase
MKTLLFTMEYPPFHGGVANYYYNLEQNWPEAGQLQILPKKYPAGLAQYRLYLTDLKQAVVKEKIDYIIVGQVLPLGSVVYLFSLLFHKPYAVVFHGMDFTLALTSRRKRWLLKRILGRAHKIICANSYVAKLIRDFIPALSTRVVVVNPGVSAAVPFAPERVMELRRQYGLTDKKVILSLGRLVKRKGVDSMLAVLANLGPEKTAGWHYVVLGSGPDEAYLKKLCQDQGLNDLVTFVGSSSETDKWAWLELCDLMALPARNIAGDFEGFGIVYLEANLAGKPVLAGDSGGVSDAVLNGLNGLLVDPDDLGDIALGLEKLMADPKLRESLGQKGLARARVDFNWRVQAKQVALEINS